MLAGRMTHIIVVVVRVVAFDELQPRAGGYLFRLLLLLFLLLLRAAAAAAGGVPPLVRIVPALQLDGIEARGVRTGRVLPRRRVRRAGAGGIQKSTGRRGSRSRRRGEVKRIALPPRVGGRGGGECGIHGAAAAAVHGRAERCHFRPRCDCHGSFPVHKAFEIPGHAGGPRSLPDELFRKTDIVRASLGVSVGVEPRSLLVQNVRKDVPVHVLLPFGHRDGGGGTFGQLALLGLGADRPHRFGG
mmetsp:Transcript_30735/g.64982  ORF Transcript_30735/g.64982 Transcript_30735/m.64982 type:complete len:244 (+) Transcript_30735:1748-2479(+)